MKKTLIAILATVSVSASAMNFDFWNDTNYVAVDRNGYPVKDNGIFAFNPYEFTNPKWYAQEFMNMVDEFDKEINNDSYRKFTGSNYGFPVSANHK